MVQTAPALKNADRKIHARKNHFAFQCLDRWNTRQRQATCAVPERRNRGLRQNGVASVSLRLNGDTGDRHFASLAKGRKTLLSISRLAALTVATLQSQRRDELFDLRVIPVLFHIVLPIMHYFIEFSTRWRTNVSLSVTDGN